MSDKPKYMPSQTITLVSYAGKQRQDHVKVYEAKYDYAKADWLYSVELVPDAPASKIEFRKFWESKLEVET